MGWLARFWARITCHHDWQLMHKEKILGPLQVKDRGGSYVMYHYLLVYRCRRCGATRSETAL